MSQDRPSTPWPRGAVVLVTAAAAVVVVGGVHEARGILGPVFLALVMTIVTQPLRHVLRRWLPEGLVSLVCVLTVVVLVGGLSVALLAAVARFGTLLGSYQPEFDALLEDAVTWLDQAGVSREEIASVVASFDLGRLSGVVTSALGDVAGALSSLAFILALCLFMTIDGSRFPERLLAIGEDRTQLVAALGGFARGTRRYLLVSTVFGLAVAVLDAIALALLDVPAPWLWGLLAFLTNYIPNIGFVIGLVPPALLALLEGGLGLMLVVVAVYCVLNVIIQSGIQPRVVGGAVGLSTTLTFVSLVFWSWVIGPVGAVLAVPLSLLARAVLVDADPSTRWLVPLIANRDDDTPAPTPS